MPAKRSKEDVKYAVDLLWFHQIHRENAVLHDELKKLKEDVTQTHNAMNTSQDSVTKTKLAAEEALASIKDVVSDHEKLKIELGSAKKTEDDVARQFESLNKRLDGFEAEHKAEMAFLNNDNVKLQQEVMRLKESNTTSHSTTEVMLFKAISESEARTETKLLSELEKKVAVLAPRPNGPSNRVKPGIDDDSDMSTFKSRTRTDMGQMRANIGGLQSRSVRFLPDSFNQLSIPRIEAQYQPKSRLVSEAAAPSIDSLSSDDIDLDHNATMLSYVNNMTRAVIPSAKGRSLTTASFGSNAEKRGLDEVLAQGRFQSWETYFAEGQNIFRQIPRKNELLLVQKFVDGLYSRSQKDQCFQYLDVNGWTWNSIAAFGFSATPCALTQAKGNRNRSETASIMSNRTASVAELEGEQDVLAGLRSHREAVDGAASAESRITRSQGVGSKGQHRSKSHGRLSLSVIHCIVSDSPQDAAVRTPAMLDNHPRRLQSPSISQDAEIDFKCGVPLKSGRNCGRHLRCKTHSKAQKRAVTGRSQPFDNLWLASHPLSQSQQQSSYNRNTKLSTDDIPRGSNQRTQTQTRTTMAEPRPAQELAPMIASKLATAQKQQTDVARAAQGHNFDRNAAAGRQEKIVSRTARLHFDTDDVVASPSMCVQASPEDMFKPPPSRQPGREQRKRKATDVFSDDGQNERLASDDVDLPNLPLYYGKPVVEKHRKHAKKRARLPPPPAIPILPTSDD